LGLAGCNPSGGEGGKGAVTACASKDLALKRVSEDASVSLVTYRFENRSSRVCSLKGYPDIVLTGPDGSALDAKVERFAPPPAVSRRSLSVVLRPGMSADFNVVFPKDAGKGTCRPFVKLTATPPGSDWGLDVAEDKRLCDGPMLVSVFTTDPSDVN
jgi:hypothetical protein